MRTTRRVFLKDAALSLTALSLSNCAAIAAHTPDLKSLYEQHQWFELREALALGTQAPDLYMGAAAAAFNDLSQAEKYLGQVIARSPDSASASDAHELLGYIYARSGRYRDTVQQLDAMLNSQPDRADVQNVRAIFQSFSRHADQSIENLQPTPVHGSISKDGAMFPASVHGKTVHWALDTDLNLSAMSEAEAHWLGVPVDDISAQAGDANGGTTKARTAVVDELVIGGLRVKNVAFLILPDSQPPMSGAAQGERGLIGLPVALALRAITWKSNGDFVLGPSGGQTSPSDPNLCLDGLSPVTRVECEGKPTDFIFDTGNQAGTELWSRFATDFAATVTARGKKGTMIETEIGGSTEREVIRLPELRLRVGGFNVLLKSPPVLSKPVGDDFHHGLLGMDALSQAREVHINFEGMTVQLLP
jgi:hypothetical protein